MARVRQQRAPAATVWLARLETSHFEFEAAGTDVQEALAGLLTGLRKHGKQCGLPRNWYKLYWDQLDLKQMEVGTCFRDGSQLT